MSVARLRALAARAARSGDEGMTLVEVMLASILTLLCSGILVASLIPFMTLATSSRVHSTSTSEALIVFARIDQEVRFADAINIQGLGASGGASASRYVEWRTPAESSPTHVTLCTQWRFDPTTRMIQERQWNEGATPTSTWTTRLTLAIDKPNEVDGFGHKIYPFSMTSASTSENRPLQSLQIWVVAGDEDLNATTEIKTQFVARNSTIVAPTNDNDNNGSSDGTPVCDPTHNRP